MEQWQFTCGCRLVRAHKHQLVRDRHRELGDRKRWRWPGLTAQVAYPTAFERRVSGFSKDGSLFVYATRVAEEAGVVLEAFATSPLRQTVEVTALRVLRSSHLEVEERQGSSVQV